MLEFAIVRKNRREELDVEDATVQIENKQTLHCLDFSSHT